VEELDTVSTQAEVGQHSEAEDTEEQACRSLAPEEGQDLLRPSDE
jgi:hypothetical protein